MSANNKDNKKPLAADKDKKEDPADKKVDEKNAKNKNKKDEKKEEELVNNISVYASLYHNIFRMKKMLS